MQSRSLPHFGQPRFPAGTKMRFSMRRRCGGRRLAQRRLLRRLRLLLFLLVDARAVAQLLVRSLGLWPARGLVAQLLQRFQKSLELRTRHALVLSPARQYLRQSFLKSSLLRETSFVTSATTSLLRPSASNACSTSSTSPRSSTSTMSSSPSLSLLVCRAHISPVHEARSSCARKFHPRARFLFAHFYSSVVVRSRHNRCVAGSQRRGDPHPAHVDPSRQHAQARVHRAPRTPPCCTVAKSDIAPCSPFVYDGETASASS